LYTASGFIQPVSATGVSPFIDISTSYARNEIIDLYNKKIISGTSATSFSPTQSITRAEFVTMLDRLLGLEPVTSPVSPYSDVAEGAWYHGWIQAAVQLELTKGTSATTFAPTKAVTRQEAAVLLANALKQTSGTTSDQTVFKDGNQIATWARAAVAALDKLGLMKGDGIGHFRPTNPITRQETAVLIDRVLQNSSWAEELEAEPNERITIGWQYDQTTAEYESNILKSNVNTLSPRWYFVGGAGTVTNYMDTSLITWAKQNDKQIWAMVGNRSDQEATHQMLSTPTARNAVIDQLAAMVSKYELAGLNIDFENVAPDDRGYLTTFITQLAAELHTLHAILSFDVSPDLGSDWTEAYDYAALGKQVDYIVMMGYDEHYGESVNPGSVASLSYVQQSVNTLLQVVSSQKVILALPFYNRDWTLKQNGTVSSSDYITLTKQNQLIKAYSLKPIWNAALGQYIVSYSKLSMKHMIWVEDSRSLIAKYKLAVSKNLAGIAYWYIGGESSDIWTALSNAEKFYD
ncbi:MAG: S-layer homology domain-containing protein, partial [Gorillibacterium sp.]|nr:S-layer homology domain-containing protein [Gorillibacterium sp.]